MAGAFVAGLLTGEVLERHSGPCFGGAQFDQIRPGMTEGEVEAILGLPPGDYRPPHWIRPGHYVSTSDPVGFPAKEVGMPSPELEELGRLDIEEWVREGKPLRPSKVNWKSWWGRAHGIDVAFDEHRRVLGACLLDMVPPRDPPSWLRKLRWWWLNL